MTYKPLPGTMGDSDSRQSLESTLGRQNKGHGLQTRPSHHHRDKRRLPLQGRDIFLEKTLASACVLDCSRRCRGIWNEGGYPGGSRWPCTTSRPRMSRQPMAREYGPASQGAGMSRVIN